MSEELTTLAYIGGGWSSGRGGQFAVNDPATGETITYVPDCVLQDFEAAIVAADKAFQKWKLVTAKERAAVLLRIRDHLLLNKDHIATTLTKENGKPKNEALGEVGFAASFFEWFAEEGRRQYGDTVPSPVSSKRYVTIRQPVGVAALITPWNFPIGMIGRKVAAALAAGCTCVVKPAEDTPLTALAFAKVCEDANVPCGVVNVVTCSRTSASKAGALFCESTKIQALSFTGSTAVGKWLYSQCGPTVKKLSLELGGDAPFIVFPTANLDDAIQGAMASKFRNTGQTCVTANRFFVHESIHDEFVKRFCTAMEGLKMGNGLEAGISQGPLINKRQHERLVEMVNGSIAAGAKLICGGSSPGGLYYAPTLLTGVKSSMPVFKEEIFGPVAAIMKFSTEEEVIEMANASERGLAGYFYSNDLRQIWRVAEAMEVGMVGVNEPMVSTCETPFGGIKYSGLGKEGSRHGLDDFSHIKMICFGV